MSGCWGTEPSASPCAMKLLPRTYGPPGVFLASSVSKGGLGLLCQINPKDPLDTTRTTRYHQH